MLVGVALSGLTAGCSQPPPRSVSMTVDAVNTADRILVLEGKTDLPGGSRLKAQIMSRDGTILMKDLAVVRGGAFFFDFDLRQLSEFNAYRALITFDPEESPLGVRLDTGLWGEALEGAGVRKLEDRRIFSKEKEVLLSATAAGKDWEGRDFAGMDPNERSRLISELEGYLTEKTDDKSAKLALARAYLADEPKEYSEGSRAHLLLTEVARSTQTDRDGSVARDLLAEIESQQQKKNQAVAKRESFAKGDRYRNDFTVGAGQNLGGFRMGTPYRVAGRYFKMDHSIDFADPNANPTVTLLDFHNVELTYSLQSRRLLAARTTSSRFKLPEGYGVGSLLQELQQEYGMDAVYTPKWASAGTDSEGRRLYTGSVVTAGLVLEFTRSVDQFVGIPVDKVSAITVYSGQNPP